MKSKSVDSILPKILGGIGFLDCLLGAGMIDTNFNQGAVVLVVGGLLLLWCAYEEGYFRANKK